MVDYSKWDNINDSSEDESESNIPQPKPKEQQTKPLPSTSTSTMSLRTVARKVVSREQAEGAGARVRRSIGGGEMRSFSPFLLLDEFFVKKPGGFPDHPHRGFETVTYMLEGKFMHEDFCGHRGTIGPGDLQWMTAGRGIVHAEMPATNQVNRGLQLWVNLPRSKKLVEPRYQELLDKDVPRATSPDGKTVAKVIAGEAFGVHASVKTYTPIYYLDFQMQPHASFEQKIPASYNAFAYTLSGLATFSGTVGEPHTTLILSQNGDYLKVETGDSEAHFVVIAGEPINEPVIQHGPFVMNDQREIYQAIMDYQSGTNGFENAKNWQSQISQA